MHAGQHLGEHVGSQLGEASEGAVIPTQFPARAQLLRINMLGGLLLRDGVLLGLLEISGGLRGQLQQKIGGAMIDLAGSMSVLRGDSLTYVLTVTDAAGAAIDLTGYAVELQIKEAIGDPDPPLISKAIASGIVLQTQSGATKGKATITITSADTDLAARQYMLDAVVSKDGIRTHVIGPATWTVRGVVNAP